VRIRLVTRYGDGLPLLHRLLHEGCTVDFWAQAAATRRCLVGIVPQAPRPDSDRDEVDLLLADMTGLGRPLEALRAYGASGFHDSLEMDRAFALKLVKASGLLVPAWEVVPDVAAAVEFLRARPPDSLWVVKPATALPACYAFAPANRAELDAFLEFIAPPAAAPVGRQGGQASPAGRQGPLLLQERLSGVDVAIGAFYWQGRPLLPTVHSAIEARRFLAGGVGPVVGSAGCVAWFWRNARNKLWRATHERLAPTLERFRYTGPLTLRVCVPDRSREAHFLEAVCRFDFPLTQALAGSLDLPLSEFLRRVAQGELGLSADRQGDWRPSSDWTAALRVSVPPYPAAADARASAGKRLAGIDPADPHFWPMDVARGPDGAYVTAGTDGVVCDLTARAATLPELQEQTAARARDLVLLEKQYRIDVVETASRRIDLLREWKYLE
jgi:phosphoribosylamine-glycine ligase